MAKTNRDDDEVRSSGFFDKVAQVVGDQVSKGWFFSACFISILLWAVSGPLLGFSSTWQLLVNTGTTITTFLLVALLQNTQDRDTKALHHKMDAMAEAMSYLLLSHLAGVEEEDNDALREHADRLRDLAGVRMEES